jgi:hypothetical protein
VGKMNIADKEKINSLLLDSQYTAKELTDYVNQKLKTPISYSTLERYKNGLKPDYKGAKKTAINKMPIDLAIELTNIYNRYNNSTIRTRDEIIQYLTFLKSSIPFSSDEKKKEIEVEIKTLEWVLEERMPPLIF